MFFGCPIVAVAHFSQEMPQGGSAFGFGAFTGLLRSSGEMVAANSVKLGFQSADTIRLHSSEVTSERAPSLVKAKPLNAIDQVLTG